MKLRSITAALSAVALILAAAPAQARPRVDAVSDYSIAPVLERSELTSQTNGVRFFFGEGSHPAVARMIERDQTVSLRTSRLHRTPEGACQQVMMSALISLASSAQNAGGNAVVNIRSNWQNNTTSSTTDYKCAVGGLMAGVALKGDLVRIR